MAEAWETPIWLSPEAEAVPNTFNSLPLNDSDNAIATVFQARSINPITHIGIRHTSTTGTSPTYIASVQGVNASGRPDGTIKGGGSPASKTFSPSSLSWGANTFNWVQLDNPYTPTRGELLALNVVYSSGTVNASNFSSFAYYWAQPLIGLPFAWDFQTTWTARSGRPNLVCKSASDFCGLPVQSSVTQSFTSSSEYGVKFTLPNWFSTCRISGVRILCGLPAASTYSVYLYDGGGTSNATVLQSVVGLDGDATASANRLHEFRFTTATLATLRGGNSYRIGIVPGGAVNFTLYGLDVASSEDFGGWPLGNNACWTTRAGGGSWTDTATRRPICALLMDDMTTASGGSLINSQQLVRAGWIS